MASRNGAWSASSADWSCRDRQSDVVILDAKQAQRAHPSLRSGGRGRARARLPVAGAGGVPLPLAVAHGLLQGRRVALIVPGAAGADAVGVPGAVGAARASLAVVVALDVAGFAGAVAGGLPVAVGVANLPLETEG